MHGSTLLRPGSGGMLHSLVCCQCMGQHGDGSQWWATIWGCGWVWMGVGGCGWVCVCVDGCACVWVLVEYWGSDIVWVSAILNWGSEHHNSFSGHMWGHQRHHQGRVNPSWILSTIGIVSQCMARWRGSLKNGRIAPQIIHTWPFFWTRTIGCLENLIHMVPHVHQGIARGLPKMEHPGSWPTSYASICFKEIWLTQSNPAWQSTPAKPTPLVKKIDGQCLKRVSVAGYTWINPANIPYIIIYTLHVSEGNPWSSGTHLFL